MIYRGKITKIINHSRLFPLTGSKYDECFEVRMKGKMGYMTVILITRGRLEISTSNRRYIQYIQRKINRIGYLFSNHMTYELFI